jgi:hypothetical protein
MMMIITAVIKEKKLYGNSQENPWQHMTTLI